MSQEELRAALEKEDLRLLIGDKGDEHEIPAYLDSPTWVVDKAWEEFSQVAKNSLDAYMMYTAAHNLPHSYLLGLDILVTGVADETGKKIVDIRPTILEGPCCNSYPACPNIWSYRLYGKTVLRGLNPDAVEYPTHPSRILDVLIDAFQALWEAKGNKGKPVMAIFTRPYEKSEEETAHNLTLNAFKRLGYEVYRITPTEKPEVKNNRLYVHGRPIDMVYRRIERIHVPEFYGQELGNQIIKEATDTVFINPWVIDDLRSKTIEERCFREYEEKTGKTVSRPITLLDNEIKPDSVADLLKYSGYALKKWNSTGGKGVFLHLNGALLKDMAHKLYRKYDGRHMIVIDESNRAKELDTFKDFKEDASIQQLRLIDSRNIEPKRLVYDTRINVIYNERDKEWKFLSGISRCVPCGETVSNGNSLLTNISSGAEIAPLVMGNVKPGQNKSKMTFGPMMSALIEGKTSTSV